MTTQNCAECGTRAEPGQSFCDACGSVLGWNPAGARTGPPPAATAAGTSTSTSTINSTAGSAPEDTAEARWDGFARPGGGRPASLSDASRLPHLPRPSDAEPAPMDPVPTDRRTTDRHTDEAAGWTPPAAPGAPHPDDSRPTVPLPTGPATAASPASPASPASRNDTMSERARSLLVPVAEPAATHPAHSAVAPVLPGRPDVDRPQVRAPGPQQDTGNGPPCSWCATPNRPDRHFCTRCAMPLADTGEQTPGHRPWWRRLTGSRNRVAPWAGERPRLRRAFDRISTWLAAAIVLTLLVLTGMYLPDGIQATRDHFAKRAPVAPDEIRASRSYAGHKPQLAFDKINNSWWGPGVSQSGKGEWIEARFSRPTRLLNVIVTPGVSTHPDQIGQATLPHLIKATITTKDGKTVTRELALDQSSGAQPRAFRVGEVSAVRFTIESSYTASSTKQVAIAEIEFFGPSNADRS